MPKAGRRGQICHQQLCHHRHHHPCHHHCYKTSSPRRPSTPDIHLASTYSTSHHTATACKPVAGHTPLAPDPAASSAARDAACRNSTAACLGPRHHCRRTLPDWTASWSSCASSKGVPSVPYVCMELRPPGNTYVYIELAGEWGCLAVLRGTCLCAPACMPAVLCCHLPTCVHRHPVDMHGIWGQRGSLGRAAVRQQQQGAASSVLCSTTMCQASRPTQPGRLTR